MRALLDSAWFQQQLIDALPVPVFYKDSEGCFLGCNKAYETFMNMKKDEIIGKTVAEMAPEELVKVYQEQDEVLLRNGGVQVYESLVSDADGSTHNVVFHKATIFTADGSVVGLIGAILDITERRERKKNSKTASNCCEA